MEGIPIYYVTQPSADDSLNVFFLPPSYKSQADVKIKDVVANFPHKDSGRFFHYRFYAICDKDQKTWVDISNMSAKAPIVDNRILVKVLEIEKPHYSKLFATVSKATREEPVSQQQQQQQPQPEPRIQSQASRSDSMNTSGTRQNRANTAQERQQPPVNVTSPPKTQTQTQAQVKPPVQVKSPPVSSAAHYEDLLGGDHSSNTYTQTTVTATTTRVTFGSPQGDTRAQDDSEVTKNMTREELTAYKANKMNQAIQDKLAFANQIWADENKNQEEKEKAYNELEDNIKKWAGKNGQRNNIRALLCTLHEVAWPESGWAPLSLTSLMMPNQIKVNFFKALTKFHPDKNSSGDYRQRYIAERVTNELNAAWDEFRKTNP